MTLKNLVWLLLALAGLIQPQLLNAQETKAPSGIWEYEDSSGGAVGINLWKARQPSWHDGPPLKGEQLNPLTNAADRQLPSEAREGPLRRRELL